MTFIKSMNVKCLIKQYKKIDLFFYTFAHLKRRIVYKTYLKIKTYLNINNAYCFFN